MLLSINNAAEANRPKLQQVAAEIPEPKLQQVAAEITFPSVFSYIPWGHHIEIITKCKSLEEAFFYLQKIIEENWSRDTLSNCLHADLYHTKGAAVTIYTNRLPHPQGDLAVDLVKGNYDLGFISLPEEYDEELLRGAIGKVKEEMNRRRMEQLKQKIAAVKDLDEAETKRLMREYEEIIKDLAKR